MTNILEDKQIYRQIINDAREEGHIKGRKEGLEQGREEGLEEGLRRAVLMIIVGRFPTLARLSERELTLIQHTAPLEKLITRVSTAQTDAEIKLYLIEALDESVQLE